MQHPSSSMQISYKYYFNDKISMLIPFARVVFNTNNEDAQKLIIRPEGIEPDSENDVHLIEAETEASYEGISVTPYAKLEPGSYDIYWKGEKVHSLQVPQGGVHTFVLDGQVEDKPEFHDFLLTKENSVHMLWLIPQFFVITVGEIMFSITALEFSYSQVSSKAKSFKDIPQLWPFLQAPNSMKSVLQAANLLTVAFGNVIVIIVAEAKAFDQVSSR